MVMSTGSVIAGRYVVQRQLGSGAQGEVYAVQDSHEGDVVALKLLSALPPGDPWQEARILRRLSDPHILPIRNADLAVGQPYLVTELALHGTLADRLVGGGSIGLDPDDVVRWTRQACHGVGRAHDLRLLHNDVKPANLFLNAEGECLVADFGFTCLVPAGTNYAWPPGATAETVAPEVAAGWGTPTTSASIASDVYSLGATAYWLMSGCPHHDFTGAADVPSKMAIAASRSPAPLRALAPQVIPHIARVIARAMARKPSDRFANVADLAAALGTRPQSTRRWRRTDEDPGHIACWRGEPVDPRRGNAYIICLEAGTRPTQAQITTRHASSGRRISAGCRVTSMRTWAQAVRATMRRLR